MNSRFKSFALALTGMLLGLGSSRADGQNVSTSTPGRYAPELLRVEGGAERLDGSIVSCSGRSPTPGAQQTPVQRVDKKPRANASNPTLTSIYPDSGLTGTTVSVLLSGTNFEADATVFISGFGVSASDVNVVSS